MNWAKQTIIASLLTASLAAVAAEPGKDVSYVGRYDGAKMELYKQSDFDEVRLLNRPLDTRGGLSSANSLTLQGKSTRIRYVGPAGRSALEVAKNYEAGLQAQGFEVLFSCALAQCLADKGTGYYQFGGTIDSATKNASYQKGLRYELARLRQPSGDVYVAITVGEWTEPAALVQVVETKAMDTDKLVFLDASAMAKAIDKDGRVSLYGILFDTDKADIKAESKPTLAEIAKFMQAYPSVNLVVTGHTDNQGNFDHNVDLSRRRAAAVVAALTGQYGIASARLIPFGAGMAAPVASNAAEATRRKNRRVELVKR
ncbi:MAG: OmpA family protein [Sulfuriferula sp.]|nr:OmpA family protein [Sulfuriferula sp.]